MSNDEIRLAVELYQDMVAHMDAYDEDGEMEALLSMRDTIADALDEGIELTPEVLDLVRQTDDRLVEGTEVIRRFTDVFKEEGSDEPPRRWWWHLNEGPDVRRRAQEAA